MAYAEAGTGHWEVVQATGAGADSLARGDVVAKPRIRREPYPCSQYSTWNSTSIKGEEP